MFLALFFRLFVLLDLLLHRNGELVIFVDIYFEIVAGQTRRSYFDLVLLVGLYHVHGRSRRAGLVHPFVPEEIIQNPR